MLLAALALAVSTPPTASPSVSPTAPGELLDVPAGWRGERLELPLSFAPEIELAGFEELAFAPGMFVPDSDSYFSYALALRIEGEREIDAAFLDAFLEKYYRGLCGAVASERGLELDLDAIRADVRREGAGFVAEVALFDAFTSGDALELVIELETRAAPGATEVLGLASPLARDEPIWKQLHALGERWRAKRPAPVALNHVFFVVDRASYDALAHSDLLRSLAVAEERETVRADRSYSGLYLYGAHSYVEFLPAGSAGLAEGASGLAFGLEQSGAADAFAKRLGERDVRSQTVPITRALDGQGLPWFRMVGIEMPSAPLTLFAMEYDADFLTRWHAGAEPAAGGIARADVLARYAAALGASERRASQPFADVSEVRLALDDAQRERFVAVCKTAGHEVEEHGEERVVRAPGVRFVLRRAPQPGGVTGVELALRTPLAHEPVALGKLTLSFHEGGASLELGR